MENDNNSNRIKKSKSKKEKKHKKHKRCRKSSSSGNESQSDEMEWVEVSSSAATTQVVENTESNPRIASKVQREEWMSDEMYVPTLSKNEMLERDSEKKNSRKHQQRGSPMKLGQHERELNPYWKNDGNGIPDENVGETATSDLKLPSCSVGDGGYNWLRKAYQRVKEKAAEEGRTMEEVAVERWGSLEKLTSLLEEAEKRMMVNTGRNYETDAKQQYKEKFVNQGERHYHASRDRKTGYFRSSERKERTHDNKKEMNSANARSRSFSKPSRDENVFNKPQDDETTISHSFDANDIAPSRRRDQYSDNYKSRSFSKPSYEKSIFREPQDEHKTERSLLSEPASSSSWKKKKVLSPSDSSEKSSENDQQRKSIQVINSASVLSPRLSTHSIPVQNIVSDNCKEKNTELQPMEQEIPILTDNEMNNLAAKVIKAEILGNDALASKLKEKLDAARKARESLPLSVNTYEKQKKQEVFLSKSDRHGISRPLRAPGYQEDLERKKWGTKLGKRLLPGERATATEQLSKKMSYFSEESRHSLKQMFEREKLTTADDQIEMFVDAAVSHIDAGDKDYEIGDVSAKVIKKMGQHKQDERDYNKAIQEHKRMSAALEKCEYCFAKVKKHLVVTITPQAYLCLPSYQSLMEGHCLILPKEHISSSLLLDEDVLSEIQTLKRTLINMFKEKNQCVVFMEISMNLRYCPHTVIECYPMPIDIGELAPLYFKKAILESESEWAHNKQLIDLFKKDFQHSVPKGLPYFAVEFSTGGGYAHIIEDERFPKNFGKEIIGGMLGLDYVCARSKKEEFKAQATKTLNFIKQWKSCEDIVV